MRIALMEPFGQYPAFTGTAGLTSAWILPQNSQGLSLINGFTSPNKALRVTEYTTLGDTMGIKRSLKGAPSTKLTMAVATRIVQMGNLASSQPLHIFSDAGVSQFSMKFNSACKLEVYRRGVLAATSAKVFQPNSIYRLCFQLDYSDTASAKIVVTSDGELAPIIDVQTPVSATLSTNFAELRFNPTFRNYNDSGWAFTVDFSDIIIGLDECVDWGPQRILLAAPNVDLLAQFTRSAGAANRETVDEIPGSTADSNSSTVSGNKDVFEFAKPVTPPERIVAVGTMSLADKSDVAARKFAHVLRMGGVDYRNPDIALVETPMWYPDFWDLNPVTNLPFTVPEYMALEGFGYENRT